ncbi:hypothetical protein [Bacillus solitudinis]|nr:hypothetical protein [Bacillus solitudinis]
MSKELNQYFSEKLERMLSKEENEFIEWIIERDVEIQEEKLKRSC